MCVEGLGTHSGRLLAVLALLFSSNALAQEGESAFSLGMGVRSGGIHSERLTGSPGVVPALLYLGYQTDFRLLVEPFIGFGRASSEQEDSQGAISSSLERRVTLAGVGLLLATAAPGETRFLAGPRIGARFDHWEIDQLEADRTDLYVAAIAGAEVFLLPGLALGLEAGLEYLRFGDEKNPRVEGVESGSAVGTVAEARVRFYLP